MSHPLQVYFSIRLTLLAHHHDIKRALITHEKPTSTTIEQQSTTDNTGDK